MCFWVRVRPEESDDSDASRRRPVTGAHPSWEGGTSVVKNRTRPGHILKLGAGAVLALALAGCSQDTMAQWGRWGMPVAASEQAPWIGNLWNGAWIASLVIGAFVWGLIFWVMFRYRRRNNADVPRQSRYNLPMELLYTVVPFLIIGVLFFFTVQSQNAVLAKVNDRPVHTINVIGQKWSWSFNYLEQQNPAVNAVVHDTGTVERLPYLYLPVNEPVRFNLASADVIHSFWIPEFYFKLDVIPGHPNSFDVTPNRTGEFLGKCAELCGTYHSAMLFKVRVVSLDEYNAHLKQLAASGQTGELTPPAWPNSVPSPPTDAEHAPAEEHDR